MQTKTAYASLLVAGLVAVIPFLLPHHGLATAFYSEWAAFALGVLACFPLLGKSFWQRLEIPHSAIWLFAIAVLIAIQTLFVDHAYVTQALLPGIYIAWATLLVVLSYWIREQLGFERAVTVLAWMLLIGGALQAIVGLVQLFDSSGALAFVIDPTAASVYGNIGQRNHFATQITLASFALVYLHATDRANRALSIPLLFLFAFVLTTSSSRAAVIYIVAGFLLSLLLYRAAREPVHRRLLQGTGLLLASFLVIQIFLPLLDIDGLKTLTAMQRISTDGIDVRLSEWRKAWLMFLESPLWGVGIDNYGWYSFNYQALPEFSALPAAVLFHHSHNLIMQVLAELGAAGLLLLVCMAASWLRPVLPLWKNPAHWLILALVMVLFLHSNVEYPLWYSYFLGIAAILIGLGSKGALKIGFTPRLGQFTAGVTLIFSGAMLITTLLGFQNINNVYRLVVTTSPQQAIATLHAVSKNMLLTPLAEASMALHGDLNKNSIDQKLLLTTRVLQYRPNPHSVNIQIIYLALAGKSVEASVLMKKMFTVYTSDFPNFACNWKRAPAMEVQHLWKVADKLTEGTIECGTETNSSANPS